MQKATRIISLNPAATDMLLAMHASHCLVGVSVTDRRHDMLVDIPAISDGTWHDWDAICSLKPDCVLVLPEQHAEFARLQQQGISVLALVSNDCEQAKHLFRTLGKLADCPQQAEDCINTQEKWLELARSKVAMLRQNPHHKPPRVARVLGVSQGRLILAGPASWHNQMIALAGGEAPQWGEVGQQVCVPAHEWCRYDPQAIILDQESVGEIMPLLQQPEWNGVAAMRTGRCHVHSGDLASRVGARYGFYAMLLVNDLHAKALCKAKACLHEDAIVCRRDVEIPFEHVRSCGLLELRMLDMPTRSLLLRFHTPRMVLSSLTGWSRGILALANNSSFHESWALLDQLGQKKVDARYRALFGLTRTEAALLYTGVDVANHAYAEARHGDVRVGVIATAGVLSNAMRATVDSGDYVEPGTINLIILVNRQLSPAAMTQTLVRASEAKVAAMQDLDVRSCFSPTAATGTGTDNVAVVSGDGPCLHMAGGHTKLGELLARAVHKAVLEAIRKQNGLHPGRSIMRRLFERRIILPAILAGKGQVALARRMEDALKMPEYAGFMQMAFDLADSRERGLVQDVSCFEMQCLQVAGRLAGHEIGHLSCLISLPNQPEEVRMALNALAAGLANG